MSEITDQLFPGLTNQRKGEWCIAIINGVEHHYMIHHVDEDGYTVLAKPHTSLYVPEPEARFILTEQMTLVDGDQWYIRMIHEGTWYYMPIDARFVRMGFDAHPFVLIGKWGALQSRELHCRFDEFGFVIMKSVDASLAYNFNLTSGKWSKDGEYDNCVGYSMFLKSQMPRHDYPVHTYYSGEPRIGAWCRLRFQEMKGAVPSDIEGLILHVKPTQDRRDTTKVFTTAGVFTQYDDGWYMEGNHDVLPGVIQMADVSDGAVFRMYDPSCGGVGSCKVQLSLHQQGVTIHHVEATDPLSDFTLRWETGRFGWHSLTKRGGAQILQLVTTED